MDEVLAQFVKECLTRWNATRGTHFRREDINMWQMENTLGAGAYETITQWINEPQFFENLEPFPGAIEGFKELMAKHDVVIATSLAGDVQNGYDSKRRWVKKHIPEFDMKNFICTSRKDLLRGDVLIDDASHYLDAWHRAGNVRAIVMDASWNKDNKDSVRVANWSQVMRVINAWVAIDDLKQFYKGQIVE
jgi:5'(3')-deoxyribonucleotidase